MLGNGHVRFGGRGRADDLAQARHRGSPPTPTKLDRLARSLPDAREILDDLTRRAVKLSLGGSIHDPTDPVGRLLFNMLAMVAEFEADLIRLRTREGMRVAKAKGRLRGKQTKLNPRQEAHLVAPAPRRRAQHRRAGRPVRPRTLDRLPRHPATNGVTPSTRAASAELTPRLDNGWRSELASGPLPWPVVSSQRVPGGVVHKLPADLRKALIASTTALDAWKDITPLARNEFICWVEDAKQEMTRERRIRRTQEELEEGQRRPCCWPGCKHRERTGR
jgi:hypothetical protein